MKLFTVATVPDALGAAWLQHLRDFDAKHPGCHFQVVGDAAEASLAQVIRMMRVNPSLPMRECLTAMGLDERQQREIEEFLKGH